MANADSTTAALGGTANASGASGRAARLSSVLLIPIEVALAILSILFHRVVRATLRLLVDLHFRFGKAQSAEWRISSAEYFRRPLVLPVVMVEGPRWNTHAITASVGPIFAEQQLELDLEAPRRSADSWSIVLYRYPGYRALASVGSGSAPSDQAVSQIPVERGRFTLVVRYYGWNERCELPAIAADGLRVVEPVEVPANVNDFLRQIARNRLFYLALHYYVWVMLKFRDRLSASWVEREFLPVGNPETRFAYGIVRPGQSVRVQTDSRLLSTSSVYLTVYSRSSFPTFWCAITEPDYLSPASTIEGMYLVRIHPRGGVAPDIESLIQVSAR